VVVAEDIAVVVEALDNRSSASHGPVLAEPAAWSRMELMMRRRNSNSVLLYPIPLECDAYVFEDVGFGAALRLLQIWKEILQNPLYSFPNSLRY